MRQRYLITYDISDPKRLRRVYKVMRGYGAHLQLSVFECDLSATERVQLEALLTEVIHDREDQVLIVDLGPSQGRGIECIQALGRAYGPLEREPLVV